MILVAGLWPALVGAAFDQGRDLVPNVTDNCTLVRNTLQLDADDDGYGNARDADITGDRVGNFAECVPLAPSRDVPRLRFPLGPDKLGTSIEARRKAPLANTQSNRPRRDTAAAEEELFHHVIDLYEIGRKAATAIGCRALKLIMKARATSLPNCSELASVMCPWSQCPSHWRCRKLGRL